MRSALHVIDSIDPNNGGTSVSVPALLLATAATQRYSNSLFQLDQQAQCNDLGPNTTVRSARSSVARIYSNMLIGGELEDAISCSDVVQIHGLWQGHCITAGVAARHHRKPLVISAHGMLESWALRNKIWKKWIYSLLVERPNLQRCTLLRALTLAEASDYRRFGLTNPIAIIPNGVDPVVGSNPQMCLSCWPELRDRRVVLYLSRIHYKKGVDLLVKAWAKVSAQFADAHLVIAGPDSEGTRSKIEQLVKDRDLSSRITFTGGVFGDLKASLMSAASLFILPSHSEGFSVAVLEALAAGLPVIITKGCNFPEVSVNGAGWIISPNEYEIHDAMREALESSTSDLKDRGTRGQQLVQSRYSWPHIGQQMADAYDWSLGGPRPSSMEIWD
jgi:glycosyltransferase involved in cell wall biosynthesis